jgi:PAS domain S-box-containing protein
MKKREPKRQSRSARTGNGAASASTRRRTEPQPETSPRERAKPDERPAPPPTEQPSIQPTPEPSPSPSPVPPIVGIGASAGGLEALEEFLRHVPSRSGMAYVIVQHLDPTHKGAMVELLQRVASIPVVQVKDRTKVEPDCVYVIPPNKDMSLLHGVLHLMPQTSPRGLNLPIDFFFRSLAEDLQERGIGVILSGMGSDGTLGLRAIKEKGGAAFVQSLASAKFAGMPSSAIDAGLADVVAAADELPLRIAAYHQHAPYIRPPEAGPQEKQLSALEKIFILLRAHTGNDFSLYKRSTIYRRIERRMGLHQIDKIVNYVRFLRENPREVELLFKELLIGVTSFFRDPEAWDHLGELLPDLLRSRPSGSVLRAWVAGCSTGEEAYSLAMILSEVLEQVPGPHIAVQIFATDLDRDAIEKARQGLYPANIAADVSAERLRRFFVQEERGYRIRKDIREAVVFAPQNIIMDPPFTRLDLLLCRNLLIYLSAELQKKLIPLFHYALSPGGILFLGSAETVGPYSSLFGSLDSKSRLYRRLQSSLGAPAVEFPPALATAVPEGVSAEEVRAFEPRGASPANLGILADRAIVQRFAPATILTNDKGDILYIGGRTGKFLEPAVGKANLNVFAMAREGLRYELSSAFATALREDGLVTKRAAKVTTNGSAHAVDLTVQRLAEPNELRGTVLIALTEVPAAAAVPHDEMDEKGPRRSTTARFADLQRELQHAREEVQTTREEMQTSQEELKSANEELQSTNEELQSTNEELTTSKEEMQSMNEELQTVNHELQSKVDELSRSNNDMKNLLNSTDIATLFLDDALLVRRFTTQTAKLIKLIPADAGRPITDIATELNYPKLSDDARDVLRTLVFKETEVSTRDGRWFMVRIMPYRTIENVIDGVVITFTDATSSKALEAMLREQADQLKQMAESPPNLVWACRPDGACDYLSPRWLEFTRKPEAEQLGYGWLDQVHPDEREHVREQWKAAVKTGTPLDTELRLREGSGAYRWFKTRGAPIRDTHGAVLKWYCTCTDVDDLKQATERLTGVIEELDDACIVLDGGLAIVYLNKAAEGLLGSTRQEVLGKSFMDSFPRTGDSVIASKLREAVREGRALSFQAPMGQAQHKGTYALRVLPRASGLSIVCRRVPEPA